MACINGATQIRAGVIRPEVVIPTEGSVHQKADSTEKETDTGLQIGAIIRVIRAPYFGKIGEVTDLPSPLQVLESESKARVLKVSFDGADPVLIPRANVERIEE